MNLKTKFEIDLNERSRISEYDKCRIILYLLEHFLYVSKFEIKKTELIVSRWKDQLQERVL